MKKNPLRVRCDVCGHVWTLMFLPMVLETAGLVAHGARCPRCGGDGSRIFLAPGRRPGRV